MNLRDLKYLVAVADYQHFGNAAKACNVSQPSLSMQLKKLEEYLNVVLFERNNRRVMITPIGREIAARARAILQWEEEIKALAMAEQDPFSGELRLGGFPTLAPYYFPEVVSKVKQQYEKLTLYLVEEKTLDLVEKLRLGELDGAFLALPLGHVDDLMTKELFEESFLLAVPEEHVLAEHETVGMKELDGARLLLLEDGHCLREQALGVCDKMGALESQDFKATSLETLRQMVVSGVGITLIPEMAKRNGDGLVYIPFEDPMPSRIIAMAWRPMNPKWKCLQAIADLLGSRASS